MGGQIVITSMTLRGCFKVLNSQPLWQKIAGVTLNYEFSSVDYIADV